MRESEFKNHQSKQWVRVTEQLPTSRMKVLVSYLDENKDPHTTVAFYVKPQQIPKGDKGFKGAEHTNLGGKLWVRSGFYEKMGRFYPERIKSDVIAWQPLPPNAVWMVKDLMQAKQDHLEDNAGNEGGQPSAA